MSEAERASGPGALVQASELTLSRLQTTFSAERERWSAVHPALDEAFGILERLASGSGKRLRPAFCYWAHRGGGGDPGDPRLVDLMAGLELLHAFALAHDDVMDGSDSRRGQPTVHRSIEAIHRGQQWSGDPAKFGEAGAILLGDLGHVMADTLVAELPIDVRHEWNLLRIEVNVGQYLDVLGAAMRSTDPNLTRAITVYKSARYSVVRPLRLGALLAGRGDLADQLERFGEPLGVAFQLRDDILGVFGDPEVTGKPVGDDLREAKATELLAVAHERATPTQSRVLEKMGAAMSAADVADVQEVLVDCGASDEIEDRIGELLRGAIGHLGSVDADASSIEALESLARYVAVRLR